MTLKIALTKGRIEKQVVKLFKAAQIDVGALENKERKLVITLKDNDYQIILAKGQDVLTYLDNGVVDLGIVGRDFLLEEESQNPELLDLKLGKCQFILAALPGFDIESPKRKVIASKYPHVAQKYFASQGLDVEIIKIEGSVELAPLINLADGIIDITETGTTLRENNLQVYTKLDSLSTRLVANAVALKQKREEILTFMERLKKVIKEENR